MPPPCIGFEIGLGHICWYFRAYICSKILKVLHPCIGFGIGLGHIWGHANAWIWYIHAYAWILYIHVLSHISHIPKAEIFGFMFQYLSSERMGLRMVYTMSVPPPIPPLTVELIGVRWRLHRVWEGGGLLLGLAGRSLRYFLTFADDRIGTCSSIRRVKPSQRLKAHSCVVGDFF